MTHEQAMQMFNRQSASLAKGRRHHLESVSRCVDSVQKKLDAGERLDVVETQTAQHYGLKGKEV